MVGARITMVDTSRTARGARRDPTALLLGARRRFNGR